MTYEFSMMLFLAAMVFTLIARAGSAAILKNILRSGTKEG